MLQQEYNASRTAKDSDILKYQQLESAQHYTSIQQQVSDQNQKYNQLNTHISTAINYGISNLFLHTIIGVLHVNPYENSLMNN